MNEHDDLEEATESPSEAANESETDEDSIDSYVASLSDADCHYLYEKLRTKYEGEAEGKKYSMADIAEGK
jgi:hypothetical protein